MRPRFHPRLINGPFGDPGLFIPFLFENRAVIFDLGQTAPLSARELLKISHIFITHTHMDHFIGFDRLLRLFLGRDKTLHLYGPEGFIDNLAGKLAGYRWNLVDNFKYQLTLCATEVAGEALTSKYFRCREKFSPRPEADAGPFSGELYREPGFAVSAAVLDHGIACLGFCLKEQYHVNIRRERLERLGLQPGPWLNAFKQALYASRAPDTVFEIPAGRPAERPRRFVLAELTDQIATITPGQKIAYVADVRDSRSNRKKIVRLAKNADHLYIEAAFLDRHRDIAAAKNHLTARQAGELAAMAGARQFSVFHFSPRYRGQEVLLYRQAEQAYQSFKKL